VSSVCLYAGEQSSREEATSLDVGNPQTHEEHTGYWNALTALVTTDAILLREEGQESPLATDDAAFAGESTT